MTDDTILRLAAVRRVATRAGALRFNKQIGTIIGADVAANDNIDRAATLARLLSLYNQMRAAKLYGQDQQFQMASQAMADAITKYSQQSPGGADKIRSIVKKLTFTEEEKAHSLAANKAKKTSAK